MHADTSNGSKKVEQNGRDDVGGGEAATGVIAAHGRDYRGDYGGVDDDGSYYYDAYGRRSRYYGGMNGWGRRGNGQSKRSDNGSLKDGGGERGGGQTPNDSEAEGEESESGDDGSEKGETDVSDKEGEDGSDKEGEGDEGEKEGSDGEESEDTPGPEGGESGEVEEDDPE